MIRQDKTPLLGMSLYELKALAQSLGMPSFVGGQIAKWLYGNHVVDIDEMTNISKANRERLKTEYCIGCMPPRESVISQDGTIKDGLMHNNEQFPDSDPVDVVSFEISKKILAQ